MKKSIIIILAMAISIGLAAQNNLEQGKQEAGTFLKSLVKSVNAGNYKMFGLRSAEEAALLEPDQVFVTNIIPLDLLRKYEGGEVRPLIMNVNRASCTVINSRSGQPSGLVELELEKGKYVVKGYSASELSDALGKINKEYFRMNFSIVRVPALNLYFGSFGDSEKQLQFVSLQNNPNLKTEIGEVMPASEFLKRIVPMANEYNGLPW